MVKNTIVEHIDLQCPKKYDSSFIGAYVALKQQITPYIYSKAMNQWNQWNYGNLSKDVDKVVKILNSILWF